MTVTKRIPEIVLFLLLCVSLSAAVCSGFTEEELSVTAWLVVLCVALVCLALTRTRVGTAALWLLGSIVCAGAHFLEFPVPLWSLLLFSFASLGMFLWRSARAAVRQSDTAAAGTASAAVQMAVFSILALALAAGLWYGVVHPLSPPTRELKLITELRRMELLQVLGVSRTEIILETDPEKLTELPPEAQQEGDTPGEAPEDGVDDAGTDTAQTPPQPAVPEPVGEAEAEAIGYELPESRLWLLLALLPLAAFGVLALRHLRRRRWERAVQALPPEEAAVNYYRFFLSRLARAGLRRSGSQTLREFGRLHEGRLEPLFPETGDFAALTEAYERAWYGGGAVTQEERARFERAYRFFPAALRRHGASLRR